MVLKPAKARVSIQYTCPNCDAGYWFDQRELVEPTFFICCQQKHHIGSMVLKISGKCVSSKIKPKRIEPKPEVEETKVLVDVKEVSIALRNVGFSKAEVDERIKIAQQSNPQTKQEFVRLALACKD